ncbi:hypothetical protein VNO77_03556 [Canavalia gladiata]|uniref:Uncharacterized protein n=1 Tax=Canavalia gladiata TaxID=3824 RepID=A0AAN9RCC5_CANGL
MKVVLKKSDKGKGKQKVVDEVSDSWSDEISDDSDENFECLGEEVSDDSDDDIQTVPEKRTDDSDEGHSWRSEEIKTPINSDNEEIDREVEEGGDQAYRILDSGQEYLQTSSEQFAAQAVVWVVNSKPLGKKIGMKILPLQFLVSVPKLSPSRGCMAQAGEHLTRMCRGRGFVFFSSVRIPLTKERDQKKEAGSLGSLLGSVGRNASW